MLFNLKSVSLFVSFFLVACGSEHPTASSQLMERNPIVRPQGDPDYKTKDGVEIMVWIKRSENQKAVCQVLRQAHAQGLPSHSSGAMNQVAAAFELHPVEAEVVSTYAVEFACPDLR